MGGVQGHLRFTVTILRANVQIEIDLKVQLQPVPGFNIQTGKWSVEHDEASQVSDENPEEELQAAGACDRVVPHKQLVTGDQCILHAQEAMEKGEYEVCS